MVNIISFYCSYKLVWLIMFNRIKFESQIFLFYAVALLILPGISGCSKAAQKSPTSDIIERNIGGRNFYIPKAYLNMPYTTVGNDGALIQTWYPGDAVVPGGPP